MTKRNLLLCASLLIAHTLWAQDSERDLALIGRVVSLQKADGMEAPPEQADERKKGVARTLARYNPLSLTANALLTAYQKVVSPQIGANCLYETSCSHFSREAIGQFGAVKGAFLSADRMSRCNRISSVTMWRSWYADNGKIIDEPHYYSRKWYKDQPQYPKP